MNGKKICEVAMLGGALVMSVASFEAAAQSACSNGQAVSVSGSTSAFVRVGFTPKCSANVDVGVVDDGTQFGVQGRSFKGKTLYGGSTSGGGVSVCTTGAVSAPAVSGVTASAGCA